MSLAPCFLCPTWLSAAESIFEDNLCRAAPWWLVFNAASLPPVSCLDLPGTDSQLFSGHCFLTKMCASYTHLHVANPAAEYMHTPCVCQFMRRKMTELGLKVSWRDFALPYSPLMRWYIICICTFPRIHTMSVFLFKNPQTHYRHSCWIQYTVINPFTG